MCGVQGLGLYLVKARGKSTFAPSSQMSTPHFYARVNWKISLNIDSQRMKLRGLLLICFWIITTLQISRMREYLDRDANRITEHSISAQVQGSRGGPLTSPNRGFLLSWEIMTAGCSQVGNFPQSHRLSLLAGFWNYTIPALPEFSQSVLHSQEHYPSEMQFSTRKHVVKCGLARKKTENPKSTFKLLRSTSQRALMLISFDVKLYIKNKCMDFVKLFDHYSGD